MRRRHCRRGSSRGPPRVINSVADENKMHESEKRRLSILAMIQQISNDAKAMEVETTVHEGACP